MAGRRWGAKQRGAILALFAVGMFAMLALVGLADNQGSHQTRVIAAVGRRELDGKLVNRRQMARPGRGPARQGALAGTNGRPRRRDIATGA